MSTSAFRTAVVRSPSGPDSIEIIDVPVVEPGPGEARVGIAAAPVNPVDLAVAGGFLHAIGVINQPERTGLGLSLIPHLTLPTTERV
jgi:NADPH:quinone reductase-like Zn-dependent oxidoreductase